LYNPKLTTGRATLAFLKSLTSNFAAGGEILHVWNDQQTYTNCAVAMRSGSAQTALNQIECNFFSLIN
jgi:hypothetical protein